MFAFALAVGLYGIDCEVRRHDGFALAGQLGVFPAPGVVANNRRIAKEHLAWIENRKMMGPLAGWDHACEPYLERQKLVVRAYTHVEDARCFLHDLYQRGVPQWGDGDEDWMFRDIPAEIRRELDSLRHLIGDEDFIFGRLPAPMPCMEFVHK